MKYGARMQTYQDIKRKFIHLPTTQITDIVYQHYKAISSEVYLLQRNGNLLTDTFDLYKELKQAQREKKGMNDEFDTLSDNLEDIPKRVLDFTRNDDEVRYLLRGDDVNTTDDVVRCTRHHTIPSGIRDALLLDLKGVII